MTNGFQVIGSKNEAQSSQKWLKLNFDNGFEFGHLEPPPLAVSFNSHDFDEMAKKTNLRAFRSI